MNDYISERTKDICNLYNQGHIDLNTFRLRMIILFATFSDGQINHFVSVTATKNGEG